MAITISSPTIPNIADNSTNLSVTFSGATTGAGFGTTFYLQINGTNVSSATSTAASGTINIPVSANVANIYQAAKNNTIDTASSNITSIVKVLAINYNDSLVPIGSCATSAGNLTINYRITNLNLTSPTTASPINLAVSDPANLVANFSRVSNAFFARLTGFVYNAGAATYQQVFTRFGFTGNASWDVVEYGYKSAMINAMNSVSPANFKLRLITQWYGGGAYQNLSYTENSSTAKTATNGVTNIFVNDSTATFANYTINSGTVNVPFTITQGTSGTSHDAVLSLVNTANAADIINIASVSLGADVLSGNFSFNSATTPNTAAILAKISNANTAVTYMNLTTVKDSYNSGYITQTPNRVATVGSEFVPNITSFTVSDMNSSIATILGTKTFLQGRSNIRFAIDGSASCGSTISNRSVTLGSLSGFNTSGNYVYINAPSASISSGSANATLLDARSRTDTEQITGINIRAYSAPSIDINGFDVYRVNNLGVVDALGNRAVAKINARITNVANSTGAPVNYLKYELYCYNSANPSQNSVTIGPINTATNSVNTTVAHFGFNSTTNFALDTSYNFELRVWDTFGANTAGNYVGTTDVLPYGKVAIMLGDTYASIGKIWSNGTLDVSADGSNLSINTDGAIDSKGIIYSDASPDTAHTATPGSIANSSMFLTNKNRNYGLAFGTNSSGVSWIQSQRKDGSTTTYPISLNPSGGAVLAGGSQVWTSGNDGPGSGLDADLLDGQDGTFYSDIVDSGSGTGHWWMKFKNGTLIKGGTVSFTGTVSTAWGQLFTQASAQTLTYDTTVAFIDEPNVTFTPKSSPNNYLVSVWPYIGTTTNIQWWLVSAVSRVSQTYTIEWTAIGRWQ